MPAERVPNPPARPVLLDHPPTSHEVSAWPFETRGGRRYRLFAAVPAKSPPDTGWPALYLLDGNAAFAALGAGDLARHRDLAIVAVGYETEHSFDFDARSRDYTPAAPSGRGLPADSPRPLRPSGEAAQFLAALTEEVIPGVERRFLLDARRRTLWGHSYGGLFALYAYARVPGAFGGICAASPSLWWGGGMILDLIAATPQLERRPALLLTRGGQESSPATDAAAAGAAFARLQQILGARGIAPPVHALESAGHRDALEASLRLALRFAARLQASVSPAGQKNRKLWLDKYE